MTFFKKCKTHLSDEGLIFIKENVSEGIPVYDEADNSVARSREHFEKKFKESGLERVSHDYQEGFPEELFKVSIWALKPT